MRLSRKFDCILVSTTALLGVAFFAILTNPPANSKMTFAEEATGQAAPTVHHVTICDTGSKVTVKTSAATVREVLERAGYGLNEFDSVDPELGTAIDEDNFFINIYRAHPVVVLDGAKRIYAMTSSYVGKTIAADAGVVLAQDDNISMVDNDLFLEVGTAVVYSVERTTVAEEEEASVAVVPILKSGIEGVARLTAVRGRIRYDYTKPDGLAVERQETFYDLNMSKVMSYRLNDGCGDGNYYIRDDGVKIDNDGYVIVAANLERYPLCSVVETSLGTGKVYDTGTFALANPEQFDIATDWTRRNGI